MSEEDKKSTWGKILTAFLAFLGSVIGTIFGK